MVSKSGLHHGLVVTALAVLAGCGRNRPPDTPPAPDGPVSGITGTAYTFVARGSDPDGDRIAYRFSWDGGDTSKWVQPDADSTCMVSRTWASDRSSLGTYTIRVQLKDEHDLESDWSAGHEITIGDINRAVLGPRDR